MDALKQVREDINKLDTEIMPLLEKRLKLSLKVIEAKKEMNKEIYDPSREMEIFDKCNDFDYVEELKSIYSEIMKQSKILQRK